MFPQAKWSSARVHEHADPAKLCTRPIVSRSCSLSFAERVRAFARHNSGAVAMVFGLCTPILAIVSAAAIQFAALSVQRTELQSAADSAALGGAKELNLATTQQNMASQAAVAMAQAQLAQHSSGAVELHIGGHYRQKFRRGCHNRPYHTIAVRIAVRNEHI